MLHIEHPEHAHAKTRPEMQEEEGKKFQCNFSGSRVIKSARSFLSFHIFIFTFPSSLYTARADHALAHINSHIHVYKCKCARCTAASNYRGRAFSSALEESFLSMGMLVYFPRLIIYSVPSGGKGYITKRTRVFPFVSSKARRRRRRNDFPFGRMGRARARERASERSLADSLYFVSSLVPSLWAT